uniref:40S ribosomal protein S4-3 n=1 Tax=Zea mays TaxID=4577 RepID=A0A804QTK7_MAIZE
MDTTTCSPSWWPSPSSCSRPLFFHLCAYQLVQPPWQMFFPSLQQHLGGCQAARRACAASVTTLFTPLTIGVIPHVSCVRRNA